MREIDIYISDSVLTILEDQNMLEKFEEDIVLIYGTRSPVFPCSLDPHRRKIENDKGITGIVFDDLSSCFVWSETAHEKTWRKLHADFEKNIINTPTYLKCAEVSEDYYYVISFRLEEEAKKKVPRPSGYAKGRDRRGRNDEKKLLLL